jgi:hypothetical protein
MSFARKKDLEVRIQSGIKMGKGVTQERPERRPAALCRDAAAPPPRPGGFFLLTLYRTPAYPHVERLGKV